MFVILPRCYLHYCIPLLVHLFKCLEFKMDAIHLDDVKVMFTLKTYPAHTIEGFSKLDVNIPSNEGQRGKQKKSAGRNL